MIMLLAMGSSARWPTTLKLAASRPRAVRLLGSVISRQRTIRLDGFCARMRGPLAARLRHALKPTSPHVARRGLRVWNFRTAVRAVDLDTCCARRAPCSNFRCPTEGYVPNMGISALCATTKCEQNSPFDLESCCIVKVESHAPRARVRNPGCVKEVLKLVSTLKPKKSSALKTSASSMWIGPAVACRTRCAVR